MWVSLEWSTYEIICEDDFNCYVPQLQISEDYSVSHALLFCGLLEPPLWKVQCIASLFFSFLFFPQFHYIRRVLEIFYSHGFRNLKLIKKD